MKRTSVSAIAQYCRTGLHFLSNSNLYPESMGNYRNSLNTVHYSSFSSALSHTKTRHCILHAKQSVHCLCYWHVNTRWQSTVGSVSSNDQSIHPVTASSNAVAHTKLDIEDAFVRLTDPLNSEVNSIDPGRELVVYIDGSYTPVKAADLYSMMKRFNAEEVVVLQVAY